MNNNNFNPFDYVNEIKRGFSEPQKFFLRNLHEMFKTDGTKFERCIEIGSGPTIHSVASASQFCDCIISTDYLSVNTEVIAKWKQGDSHIPDIEHFLEFVAELEGYEDRKVGKAEIADRIRSRIQTVAHCDVLAPSPVSGDIIVQYDVMITCLCLEAACSGGWDVLKETLRKLSVLLKEGGLLVMMGVLDQTYWEVRGVRFSCLPLTEEDLTTSLKDNGFGDFTFKTMERLDDCDDKSDFSGLFFLTCRKQTEQNWN